MKKVLISLGVAALLLSFLGAANANLIKNGDFETPENTIGGNIFGRTLDSLGPGGSWDVYNDLPGGWYKGLNDAGIEVQANTIVAAHSDSHYVELDSHDGVGTTNSSMSQDIQFLVDFVYYLSFYYHPRTNTPGDNGIDVYFGNLGLVYQADGISSQIPGWQKCVVDLGYVTAGPYTLTFSAVGTDNRLGGFIDDVTVAPVPEPATMLLLGTGLVGLAGLRRKFKK